MASMTGQLAQMSQVFQRLSLNWTTRGETLMQTRHAARKGTRERRAKILKALKAKKLAKELSQQRAGIDSKKSKYMHRKIVTVVPEYLKNKEYLRKPIPNDNVYFHLYHQAKICTLEEAILNHREVCHPTVKDKPNSMLKLFVELNMQSVKKNKLIGTFTRLACIPHTFDNEHDRVVAVFCKNEEEMETAKQMGAKSIYGPVEIKEILKGLIALDDFTHFIAHPSILPELTTIKGYLKKKFPNIKEGTLSSDLKKMVNMHLNGIQYTVTPYTGYLDYGYTWLNIGPVSMDVDKVKDNSKAILEDLFLRRPKREGQFVRRIQLACEDNTEKFKLDLNEFIVDEFVNTRKVKQIEIDNADDDEENDYNEGVISSV